MGLTINIYFMLFFVFFDFSFFVGIQSGFYVDFFVNNLAEVFISNVLVYTALFFGENYMIEVLTKNIIESSVLNFNKVLGWTSFNYLWFFVVILTLIFYFLFCINFVLLLY